MTSSAKAALMLPSLEQVVALDLRGEQQLVVGRAGDSRRFICAQRGCLASISMRPARMPTMTMRLAVVGADASAVRAAMIGDRRDRRIVELRSMLHARAFP